ncbi:porin [Pseudophaeobacter flagellatus]|uniref:porin n=1 Tax=Pseudophaeobacter flagellatus TaxID=2899119 RepID=UPI001E592AE5|nr:porin [Pseudophaeobacter flagellatus]MCD9147277.1 porin [Pseudophaeobacter flagellatus]
MKKVLFATTALIATASVAAADVRMSGYGRFGLDYNSANESNVADANYNGVSSTNITSRLRLQFDMSTETDGGVGFNARFRAQAESRDGVAGTAVFNGARFGVTYGGLTVNVGNIIGAIENTPGLYATGTRSAGTGIDGMGFHSLAIKTFTGSAVSTFNWDAYSSAGAGANGIEALYSMGGFTGHLSYSADNDTLATAAVTDSAGDIITAATTGSLGEDRVAAMLTYSFSDYYVSASYQGSDNGPVVIASNGQRFEDNDGLYMVAAGGDFGAFGARLAYGSTDSVDSVTLEGNMDIGAASNLLVWVNSADVADALINDTNAAVAAGARNGDGTSFGVNYQYDLGGGATFVAGYVNSAADENDDQFQAGVYFSF